ncbi:hypothetical protein EYF80_054796 [Liparis tanakae]|uniref:Uncharacterized protein n=1 Tax=Liparis tanakae TaxID=230148 RepID=A0A4Z2F1M6_9TELE|nr:hypothetical protein EYF80_054796 [Liparis tanakae]
MPDVFLPMAPQQCMMGARNRHRILLTIRRRRPHQSGPVQYKCECGRSVADGETTPSAGGDHQWIALRVGAIISAHRRSSVTNHIISCRSTHSHLFCPRLMFLSTTGEEKKKQSLDELTAVNRRECFKPI